MLIIKETKTQIFHKAWALQNSQKASVIITDKKLHQQLLPWLKTHEELEGIPILGFDLFEKTKNRKTKAKIEDTLFELGYGKDAHLIALGGGVVSDMVGFIAATFCRKVSWSIIPTTLLSMVDACLGGKTGLNTDFGKNSVGAFHLPEKVFIDFAVLHTLPKKEWLNGFAEIIKYGLIASSELFENMEKGFSLERDVHTCLEIKTRIIEEDYFDQGKRKILNFGHTMAHAIEMVSSYKIPHGVAVARGLIAESLLSARFGKLPWKEFLRIATLIEKLGYPRCSMDPKALKAAIGYDKKAVFGKARFVLLESIGKASPFEGHYCTQVPEELIDESLEYL